MEALKRKCLMVFLAWLPLATLAEIPKGTETQYLRDLASNPRDSARALGWLRSARGLQAIVEAGKPALLYDYEEGLTDLGHSQFPERRSAIPAEIEHILVQRFDDPVWGRKLLRFLYWEKYQTRDLFDRLYAHIADTQKFDDNYYWYRLIVNTDQIGVDAPLLVALPKLSPDGQRTILSALAQHKYAPALPEMAKFTREHRTDPAWWTKEIYDDLAKMGSRRIGPVLPGELRHLGKRRRILMLPPCRKMHRWMSPEPGRLFRTRTTRRSRRPVSPSPSRIRILMNRRCSLPNSAT